MSVSTKKAVMIGIGFAVLLVAVASVVTFGFSEPCACSCVKTEPPVDGRQPLRDSDQRPPTEPETLQDALMDWERDCPLQERAPPADLFTEFLEPSDEPSDRSRRPLRRLNSSNDAARRFSFRDRR